MNESKTKLRLNAVEISGLRGIDVGDDNGPALALKDLGQITIIAGPNGLGKTSLVEGLRLCLTGELQRCGQPVSFEDLQHRPRDLATQRSPIRLRACFSAHGDATTRVLTLEAHDRRTFDDQKKPVQSSACNLLARDKALSPASAKALLDIAHFLPQGWSERLINMDPKDGMAILTRALGFAELGKALEEIRGNAALGKAITNRVKRLQETENTVRNERDRWTKQVEAWSKARKQAEAAGAEDVLTLRTDLTALAKEVGITLSPEFAPSAAMTAVTSALAQREQEINALEALRPVAAALVQQEETAAAGEQRATVAAADAAGDLASAGEARQRAEEDLHRAERHHARATLPRLRGARDTASKRLEDAIAEARRLSEAARRATLEDLAHRADAAGAAITEADQVRASIQTEALRTASSDAEAGREAAQVALDAARTARDTRVRDAGDLLALLRSLRVHLTARSPDDPQDTQCPVCHSPFSGVELLTRLDKAIGAQSVPGLEALDREVTAAERRIDEATHQEEAAHAALEATQARLVNLGATIEKARNEIAEIRQQLGVSVDDAAAISSEIRSQVRSLPDPATFGGPGGLALRRAKAAETLADARRTLEEAQNRLHAATLTAGEPQGVVEPGPEPPTEDAAGDVLARALATRNAAALHAAEAELRNTKLQEALRESQRTREDVEARWRTRKLPDKPHQAAVEALERRATEARVQVGAHQAALAAFQPRIDALGAGKELAGAERALREAGAMLAGGASSRSEGPDPGSVSLWVEQTTAWLDKRVRAAEKERREGTIKGEKISEMRERLAKGIRSLQDGLLPRIERPRDAFLRALAPGLTWRPSAQRDRQGLTHSVAYSGSAAAEGASLLSAALSEGEQNAVTLAYLFALHVTLGSWSRWPGLVLDDPFQSADVVRVAALLDVLRGLIMHRETQVLLTTHNIDKAHWCARRMRNAGIDTVVFQLHRGVAGVRAERQS